MKIYNHTRNKVWQIKANNAAIASADEFDGFNAPPPTSQDNNTLRASFFASLSDCGFACDVGSQNYMMH